MSKVLRAIYIKYIQAADFREKKAKALQTISELVHLEKTRENKEIREVCFKIMK